MESKVLKIWIATIACCKTIRNLLSSIGNEFPHLSLRRGTVARNMNDRTPCAIINGVHALRFVSMLLRTKSQSNLSIVFKIASLTLAMTIIEAYDVNYTYAQEPEPIGIVTAVKGQVTVISAGASEAVEEGAKVFLGDRFETGQDSGAKILFNDDTLISLGENTTFEITEFVYTPTKRKSFSNIVRGKLKAIIQKFEGEESNVEFATPNGVAGIKGTIVFIDADRGIFFTLEGEAFIRGIIPGAREIRLEGGESTMIQPDGNPSNPAPIKDELKGELEEGTEIEEKAPPRDSLYKEEYPGRELSSVPIFATPTTVAPITSMPTVPPVDQDPSDNFQNQAPVNIIIPPPKSP